MSRELRKLLKKNRELEEKLFYEPRKVDWRKNLVQSKELAEALTCLSSRIIESHTPELSVLKLLKELDFIGSRPLGSYEKNALQVVEILFNYLRVNTDFDPRFYHILNSSQLAFTRLALDDLSFLDNPKHVAVKFLEKLISIGCQFDENAGNIANYFVHAVELLIDKLASKDNISSNTFSLVSRRFDEYYQAFEEKVNTNKMKLLSDIEKNSRKIEADHYTSHLIKSKTQGDEIPIFLLDFLENQLSLVLHKTISQYGTKSKQCQQILTDMDTLTWSLNSPYGDSSYEERYELDVVASLKRLYQGFVDAKLNNEYTDAFFVEVEGIHKEKLAGKRIQLDMMISANIFDDEEFDPEDFDAPTEPRKGDTFEIQSLKENAWYYLENQGHKVRSQLLTINHLREKIYFVNLSGEHIVSIEFAQQQYLAEHLQPFIEDDAILFQDALDDLSRELQSKIKVLEIEFDEFKKQETINERQQKILEEKARFAVKKRLEKYKQTVEKKRISILDEKKVEQQRVLAEENRQAEKRFKAKDFLRKLHPGSTVAIMNEKERWVQASLMLISRTTQRYIFSDAAGSKIIEPTKEELLELILKQKIKLVKIDNSKSDPMQSLVAKRRATLAGRS